MYGHFPAPSRDGRPARRDHRIAEVGAEYEEAIRFARAFRSPDSCVHAVAVGHAAGIRCASLRGRGDLSNGDCVNHGSRSEDDAGKSDRGRRLVPDLRPADRLFRLDL